jgi:glycosyltransferase domain-containing protein
MLTLKGRHAYTYRWLWHANRTRLPFRMLIADGDPESPVARWFEGPSAFPHLQVEYRKYNDRTYQDFYQKVLDAATRIETPYVMMVDNDDFLFPSGVTQCVDFLESSPEYVSAGGGIAQFELSAEGAMPPILGGKFARFWYQQSRAYRAYDVNGSSAASRAVTTCANQLTVYYNVCRVPVLRCIIGELLKAEFRLLETAELFWKLRLATFGKLRSDASRLFYLRQQGTSSNPHRGVDFVEILGNKGYIAEIQRALDAIATVVAAADGVAAEPVACELRRIAVVQLRQQLIDILGGRAFAKNWLKARLPGRLIESLRFAYERIASGRTSAAGGRSIPRRAVFGLLRRNGASRASLDEQARELAEIEATLASGEFRGGAADVPNALLGVRGG